MRSNSVPALFVLFASLVLSGCGGGGGSSPAPIAPGPPAAGPSAAPSATPTTSATAAPASRTFTGRIIDGDHGNAPVDGATVTLGTTLAYAAGGYAVRGTTATAKTAADGTFSIAATAAQLFFEVDAPGLVSLHRPLPPASAAFGDLTLPTATSEDLAGLAELNKNRAQLGHGNGAVALTLDADLELLARYRVNDMATNGYFGHTAPGQTRGATEVYLCTIAVGAFCATPVGYPIYDQENLDADASSQAQAEDGYIALGSHDGHYQNVISKTDLWIGFGEALNGKVSPGFGGVTQSYFAEEFFTSTPNADP